MTYKKTKRQVKFRGSKKSRLLFLATAALIVGSIYYVNNNISASTASTAKVTETFNAVSISSDRYRVQLVDESGQPLKAEILQKLSISSLMKGKNCGPKGVLPSHPNGGCFTISPIEKDTTIASDGTMNFPNKLSHIGQLYTYTNGKQKNIDYYFAAGAAGHVAVENGVSKIIPDDKSFIAWSSNTIIVRTADKKTDLARVVLNSNVYLQKDLAKAKDAMAKLNSTTILIKIPTSKLTTLGPDSGTPSGIPASTVSASSDTTGTGFYAIKFTKNNAAVGTQSYTVNDWYFECTIINDKKKDCTKTIKQQGQAGIASSDGIAKFSAPLVNVGSDYFVGQALGNSRYRIWSKSEIIAVNSDGKKIGSKTISSPFSRPSFNFIRFRSLDPTQVSKDRQKMIDKYNKFLQKENKINIR